jgi:hypothetical protein
MLQRADLKGSCFIALSNYFYDNKIEYLNVLNSTRASLHNLTAFLQFGLAGITSQTSRLLTEIREHVSKALFLNVMYELVHRLKSPRKSALAKRQMKMLQFLLDKSPVPYGEFWEKTSFLYAKLSRSGSAFTRDVGALLQLGAMQAYQTEDKKWMVKVRLEWPTEITETEAFSKMKKLPHVKSLSFMHADMK